jgi:type II secretory pathway component PulF
MDTPPPLPPTPLAYGVVPRRQVFNVGIFLWSLAVVVVWMLILVLVLPRFEEMFADFKMELPLATKLLFTLRTLVEYGGFVLLLLAPFVLGFVSAPMSPGGRRALRMVITLVFGIVVGLTVLGIFQPLMSLMGGMSGNSRQ